MSARVKYEEDDMEIDDADSHHHLQEEEDEVVREISVQLSPELADQLYLLQYPLQHADNNHQLPFATEARIKPKHGLLQTDHSLPRAMQLMETSEFRSMQSRTFTSQTIPLQTHMCLGKMSETTLHLVPLTHICQMRPSLDHVDAAAERLVSSSTATTEAETEAAAEEDAKKPLAFQRKESERAAMLRKSSYKYKKTSEAAEEWSDLTVTDDQSAVGVMEQLYNAGADGGCIVKNDSSNYVETLNYMPPSSNDPLVMRYAGNNLACVAARLALILHSGFPTPFQIVRARFDAKQVSDNLLLQALGICAVMIRGNYCLNSKFLSTMPENKKRARTLILLLLQERSSIERERLINVYRDKDSESAVTPEALLVLLKQVAKKTYRAWALKIDDDLVHIADYPDNFDQHKAFWSTQKERFSKELDLYDA